MRAFRRGASSSGPRRRYDHREIRIAELVSWDKPALRNAIFEHCEIQGPAVLAPDSGTKFRDCGFRFEDSAEEIVWEVPANSLKSGCIAVENCTFRRCTFSSIGIAGGPKIAATFRRLASRADGGDGSS